ncbi:MAG: hypothetical protein C5B49_03290 [Bdellovibrio sp.]|nr:MAG: hypothetical protein C5B49_03290 [Bdellovibrio sp.]
MKSLLLSGLFSGLLSLTVGLALPAEASDWSSARYLPNYPFAPTKPLAPEPAYQQIFNSVNRDHIFKVLQEMTGYLPVTVGGQTYRITNRYSAEAKAKYRLYWRQFFENLGMSVQELTFAGNHLPGESTGHNLEAVLPGKTKDSIIVIVHYDSMGPFGQEVNNPAVDDDMTGMAITLETARLLVEHKSQLHHTVRFVAADAEELGELQGAREYAKYIKDLSQRENFKLVASVDNEQTGWNCSADGVCSTKDLTFDVFSCSGDRYNFPEIGNALQEVAITYSNLKVARGCIGENSDHYAMWEIGVPSVVYSEHEPFANPHFDNSGGDTFDKIDQDYFFKIAQVGVTFAAKLAGLDGTAGL